MGSLYFSTTSLLLYTPCYITLHFDEIKREGYFSHSGVFIFPFVSLIWNKSLVGFFSFIHRARNNLVSPDWQR